MNYLNSNSGQGTIEYLVILAVVVVIALIVVALFIGVSSSPSQEITNSSSKTGEVAVGGISIVESVADPNGDSLVFLRNNSSDAITLKKISVGDVDNNFNSILMGLDSKGFSLSGLSNACPCVSGQKSVKCEFRIYYETLAGVTKTDYRLVSVPCTSDSTAVDDSKIVYPIIGEVILEDGTLAKPWIINNCLELQDMNLHLDGNYRLGNDINCYTETRSGGALYNGGAGLISIGSTESPFIGSLNGNNYFIYNLKTANRTFSQIGLFGYLKGTVSNVNLRNMSTSITLGQTGALAGSLISPGSISNCSSTGSITTYSATSIGGLVGYSTGTITNSYSSVNLLEFDEEQAGRYHGGLVGYSTGTIFNSYAYGSIIKGFSDVGGLIGYSSGTVQNSYSSSTVSAKGNMWESSYINYDYIGGLVGYMGGGDVTNSFTTTNLLDLGTGGLIGTKAAGTLSNVWWYNSNSSCCAGGTCDGCKKAVDASAFYPKVALGNDYNMPIQHNTISSNDWNFSTIWEKVDNNYPILAWQ
jgi:hypothetical protein